MSFFRFSARARYPRYQEHWNRFRTRVAGSYGDTIVTIVPGLWWFRDFGGDYGDGGWRGTMVNRRDHCEIDWAGGRLWWGGGDYGTHRDQREGGRSTESSYCNHNLHAEITKFSACGGLLSPSILVIEYSYEEQKPHAGFGLNYWIRKLRRTKMNSW